MATGLFRATISACRPGRRHDTRPGKGCASSTPNVCAESANSCNGNAFPTSFGICVGVPRSASNPTSTSLELNETSDAAQRTSTAHSVSSAIRNTTPRPGSVCCGSACRLVVVSINEGLFRGGKGDEDSLWEGRMHRNNLLVYASGAYLFQS